MSDLSPGIRRLCFAVDLERYSPRDNPGQLHAQGGIVAVLEQACRNAHLDRTYWERQPTGDGELALLAPGIDEARVVADFVRELATALYQYNRHLNDGARLRLRLAIHQGITHLGATGFGGSAVVHVCRLLEGDPLKEALREHPDTDLALIVSDQLYEDIVKPAYRDLRPDSFWKVTVDHPAKGFSAPAWIYVPGPVSVRAGSGSAAPAAGDGGRARPASRDQAVVNTIHDGITAGTVNLGIINQDRDR